MLRGTRFHFLISNILRLAFAIMIAIRYSFEDRLLEDQDS